MILIIDNDTVLTHALSEILNFAGIPTAVSDRYRPNLHADRYRAIIFTSPKSDEGAYAARAQISRVALIALFGERVPERNIYDKVIFADTVPSGIIRIIADVQSDMGIASSLEYRLSGIDASAELKNECYYFDTRVKLTRTECMILRYAIASFPAAVSSRQIARHVFKRDKMPDDSNVRTHVCSLNKKFIRETGRRIISSADGGYTVMTPVTAEPALPV